MEKLHRESITFEKYSVHLQYQLNQNEKNLKRLESIMAVILTQTT
jgi:hypothetical protein